VVLKREWLWLWKGGGGGERSVKGGSGWMRSWGAMVGGGGGGEGELSGLRYDDCEGDTKILRRETRA